MPLTRFSLLGTSTLAKQFWVGRAGSKFDCKFDCHVWSWEGDGAQGEIGTVSPRYVCQTRARDFSPYNRSFYGTFLEHILWQLWGGGCRSSFQLQGGRFRPWRGARKLPISVNGAFPLLSGLFSDLDGPFHRTIRLLTQHSSETLCESGRRIDAQTKRRGVLKKRGRVLKKRGRVLKEVCFVRGVELLKEFETPPADPLCVFLT